MFKKSKTETDYSSFYNKLIDILGKKEGEVSLKVVASELGLQEFDLLEKLCSCSRYGAFELDGDNLILLSNSPNRNVSLDIESALHNNIFASPENQVSENVSQELINQVWETLTGSTRTQINENVITPVNYNIISQLNKGEDNDLKDWDLSAFRARINEIKQFTKRIRFKLLDNYLRSRNKNLPNVLDLLNQEFKDSFRKEGDFIIFNS